MSRKIEHLASSLLPLLAILGSVTFLGLGTSWAKSALFPSIGAQGTTALRVGFSALLALAFARPWRTRLARRDAAMIVGYGLAVGAMNLFFYLALRTVPFGLAVAIEFVGPLSVAVWSSRRVADFVWIGLAIAGLAILLPIGHQDHPLDLVGVAFALVAAVFWGTYIVCGKRIGHVSAAHSVSLGLAVAALVVVPVGVSHAGAALLSPTLLAVGVGVAALSSAIPISLEMYALKRLPARAFGVLLSMEPAVAALIALVLLDESLGATQWLAIALIMSASMGCAFTARRGDGGPEAVAVN
jgi:inner membrane transporter RhtA